MEEKIIRLNKVLREFNISLDRAVEFLSSKGYEIESRPTTKISKKIYEILYKEFYVDKTKRIIAREVGYEKRKEKSLKGMIFIVRHVDFQKPRF